ncbi:MAG: 2-hydroxychromene-2-carboxylate isomerase, partial [Myxococcota bacterium]
MSSPILEFFFELSSPYSYLASTRLADVAKRTGATVVWKPMVLGAVFKENGSRAPAQIPNKGRYMLHDLQRWASQYDVPMTMPVAFPIKTITAHRAILVAEREQGAEAMVKLSHALFHAYWGEGRNISEPTVFAEVATEAGFDPEALLTGTQDPAIKDILRQHTDEAIKRGVFGAPTMFVGD